MNTLKRTVILFLKAKIMKPSAITDLSNYILKKGVFIGMLKMNSVMRHLIGNFIYQLNLSILKKHGTLLLRYL
jgi:hypothetical protein